MINKIHSFALFCLLLFVTNPVHAAVVINEIYPKISDTAWSYVELYNTDSTPVSLNQWKLDHTAGDGKSFILNASMNIPARGFLTLFGSQTAIAFSVDGDTVRLFDANGNLVDSKSYPGTLGYNTSMGRSTDGGDGWVICAPDPTYVATPNEPNKCPPPPIPTPTPFPTSTPTPTLKPTATPTPSVKSPLGSTATTQNTPPAQQQTSGSVPTSITGQALGAMSTPTPAPPPDVLQLIVSKTWIAYGLLGVAAAALSLMLVLWLRRRRSLPKST